MRKKDILIIYPNYFNPNPSLSVIALFNLSSNFLRERYRYRQSWLKQVCALGNLQNFYIFVNIKEYMSNNFLLLTNLSLSSPMHEILNAKFANPVAGIRSVPVTNVNNFLCIGGSIFLNIDQKFMIVSSFSLKFSYTVTACNCSISIGSSPPRTKSSISSGWKSLNF